MPKRSAGLLLVRPGADGPEFLLVHPGGPFWARRDAGAWSIPKGEVSPGENPLDAASREFAEEFGRAAPAGPPVDLGEVRQAGGKIVRAFARLGEFDASRVESNRVEVEWPPRSGRRVSVPEIDRAAWFGADAAREALIAAQRSLVDRALERLPIGELRADANPSPARREPPDR